MQVSLIRTRITLHRTRTRTTVIASAKSRPNSGNRYLIVPTAYGYGIINGSERGVRASANPKYVASIIYEGKPRKIWTGLEDNKVRLEKMADLGKFPFFSSIEVDYSGKYPRNTLFSATALGHTPPSDEEIENIVKQYNLSIYKSN